MLLLIKVFLELSFVSEKSFQDVACGADCLCHHLSFSSLNQKSLEKAEMWTVAQEPFVIVIMGQL